MPLNVCLKQLAKFVPGSSKLFGQGSTNQNGWNALPEDIFLLILHDHLNTNVATLKALSQTCRAYSSFCRPFLLRTVSIKDPKTLDRFKRALKRTPSIAGMVQALRITDMGVQMKLQSRRMGLAMTSVGETLLNILSHNFPKLSAFELPRLRGEQDWSTLPRVLQDAILSFLKRHPLEEVSLTTHYPFDLLRSCAGLQKMECRVYAPTTRPFNTPLPPDQLPERPAFPVLRELVIQDPSDLAATIMPNLMRSDPWIATDKLEKLTYYGDKTPSHQLPPLLSHCAETLSSLNVYVGDSVFESRIQPLDLSSLKNLTHLTLSHDRVRYGANSIAWIYGTLGILFGLGTSRLQTVEMVIRAGDPSLPEMVELSREWIFMWAMFIVQLRLILSESVVSRVQRMQVSGCLERGAVRRLFGVDSGTRFQGARFAEAGQYALPGGNVVFTEDANQRWVRVPANGHVPPY